MISPPKCKERTGWGNEIYIKIEWDVGEAGKKIESIFLKYLFARKSKFYFSKTNDKFTKKTLCVS